MFGLKPEDRDILNKAKARIEEEKERIRQEERLYKVLVEDPLDYNALVRIGKKVGADHLEIINKNGSIVRYYFASDLVSTTTAEEQKAIDEGAW